MEGEDRITEVEDRMVEINEAERKKEKWIKRDEDNLRDLWDNVKCPNIQIIGVPEEEDKKKDHEKILEEIIVENFPKSGTEIITQAPTMGHLFGTEEKHLRLCRVNQLICGSLNWMRITQKILVVALHTLNRVMGPLEGREAGSWSTVIAEQSQGEVCCWLRTDGPRGPEGRDRSGKCF